MRARQRPHDSFRVSVRAWASLLGLALLLTAAPLRAQSALDALRQRDQELEAIRAEQRNAAEIQGRLKDEIVAIGADRRKLNQALIDGARRLVETEDRIAETQKRLKPLDDSEQRLRQSLEGRRATMAEVLAALQRIGRHPPPAVMVRPEDALQSVRTAIMLNAVLPEMRTQADALASDLGDLLRVRKDIADEKDRLLTDVAAETVDQATHQHADPGAAEQAVRHRADARCRAAEVAGARPPGGQSQRFDRQG